MPRVSIIMGIYNCVDTLAEAVDSILAQTYTDWELIMCDDASTDNGQTLALAHNYEARDQRIIVITNSQNLGLAATLNHCLKHASGEFIARMDGDDISLPTRIEEEVAFLDEHPEYALVSCAMINFDENGDWGIQRNIEKPEKRDFIYGTPFWHAPVLMRHTVLTDVGNYTVAPWLRRGQDYYLWHKFYVAGHKGYNMQKPLYKMRDDKNATKRRTFMGRVNSMKAQYFVFNNLGIPKRYYWRILRHLAVFFIPRPIYVFLHKKNINSATTKQIHETH